MVDKHLTGNVEYRPLSKNAAGNAYNIRDTGWIAAANASSDHSYPKTEADNRDGKKNLGQPVSVAGLSLMFTVLFIPMLAIPLLLLGLVLWDYVKFTNEEDQILPSLNGAPSYNWYTLVSPSQFALVSSWASTIIGNVSAPFLILFSFLVARPLARASEDDYSDGVSSGRREDLESRIREILHSRTYMKLWKWIKSFIPGSSKAISDEATLVAILGVGISLLFAGLIVAGDTWLHVVVKTNIYRNYTKPYQPRLDPFANADSPDSPLFPFAAGYTPSLTLCESFLDGDDPTNELPSEHGNSPSYNLVDPSWAYLVLESGITSNATDIGSTNFTQEYQRENASTAIGTQVTTYLDPGSKKYHSFLFYLDAAYQNSSDYFTNNGFDFVAPTYSMQTECMAIDQVCGMTINSTSYNCSPIFSGNLSQEPSDGLIKVAGWNSTFYTMEGSVPRDITTGEEQNPFRFNITAQVDAVSDFVGSLGGNLPAPLVQTNSGSVGFALSCNSTVYNVTYSFINGSIHAFNATPAPARIASIIRAPLQVGYGRYNLYQSAIYGVLGISSESLESYMARSFSQVAIALSSGAFNYTTNINQRQRWDILATTVPKAPVLFLATVCALYALFSLIIFAVAIRLRRDPRIRERQTRLGLENVNDALKKAAAEYSALAEPEVLEPIKSKAKTVVKDEAQRIFRHEQ